MTLVDTPTLPSAPTEKGKGLYLVLYGLALPAVAGALMAVFLPRGPVTAAGAILSMVIGAVVGIATGSWLGRWAVLAAPVLFALFFELIRLELEAPSLDGVDLGSGFGIVLFLVTRGFHLVVALVPMIWGALIGSTALRRAGSTGRLLTGLPKVSTALLVLVITAAGVIVARPGRTETILGEDGLPLAGSIAELLPVTLGDHDQWVLIRGHDVDNPILLYLTGGPGNSDLGYTRSFLEELEEDFVLVGWDQRGVGKSYAALDPVETLTLDSAVSDVIGLSEYLTDRFDQDRIYLFGNSWGSIIGVLAAQERPDLFHAYIGAGQMVNPLATDLVLYDQMLALAEETGNEDLLSEMTGYGEPPYDDLRGYMTVIEHYGRLEPYRETDEFAAGVPGIQGTGAVEYGFMDKLNVFRGLADMGGAMYPQIQDLDLLTEVPSLEIPVYLVQGAHELSARADLAEVYADMIQAPSVDVVTFDRSGHVPHFEEAERFHRYLLEVVLAGTSG
jgi:pimeloyl-ACP methyl ester carboxylesterase